MQDREESHRVEIKVYTHKVKHLEYEHSNNCDEVKLDAARLMQEESGYHKENESEMFKEKK